MNFYILVNERYVRETAFATKNDAEMLLISFLL